MSAAASDAAVLLSSWLDSSGTLGFVAV